jgi:hypothetical protein
LCEQEKILNQYFSIEKLFILILFIVNKLSKRFSLFAVHLMLIEAQKRIDRRGREKI